MEFNMTRQIQIRRGTATENDAFTGAVGEVTMDTTNNTLRIHDGTTPGGTILAKKSEIPQQQTGIQTPDYTNGQEKTWNTEYTATEPGLLVFCAWCNGTNHGIYAVINGTNLYKATDGSNMGPGWTGGDHQAYFGGNLPIGTGDTYKLCGGSNYQKLTFFPYK